jgi:DNA repair exonuclease SbcCD nuclease subunit
MDGTLKWLHFSDLHFENGNHHEDKKISRLIEFAKRNRPDFLLASGDFFDKGNYEVASRIIKVLNELKTAASANTGQNVKLYMVPGNHDIVDSENRNELIEKYRNRLELNLESNNEAIDDKFLKNLQGETYYHFEKFYELQKKITGKGNPKSPIAIKEEEKYRIIEINNCHLYSFNGKNNSLYYDFDLENKLKDKIKDAGNKLNILLMHFGIEYLYHWAKNKFLRTLGEQKIDVVFCGHNHHLGLSLYPVSRNPENIIRQFTCGSIKSGEYNSVNIFLCNFDQKTGALSCKPYMYSKQKEDWIDSSDIDFYFDSENKYTYNLPRFRPKSQDAVSDYAGNGGLVQEGIFNRYGIIKPLTMAGEFYTERKRIVRDAKGELFISGQSLRYAFGLERERSILDELERNSGLMKIHVLLTDPNLFDVEYDSRGDENNDTTPLSRITSTMGNIQTYIFPKLQEKELHIYFIPLIQLDHLVISDKEMLYRSTLLWTKADDYKSVPFLCKIEGISTDPDKGEAAPPYETYRNYVHRLIGSCVKINEIKNDMKSRGERIYNVWKKEIVRKKTRNVSLYRLYRNQLIADLHSTWQSIFASYSKDIHWSNEEITEEQYFSSCNEKTGSADMFYNAENLLNDKTQKLLLPYIKKTENILNNIVKTYDKNGIAKIFPSADIGFPNNIQRLVGGFATGLLVVWKCGTPFIPVDTTVNVCSSSILRLDGKMLENKKLPEVFSEEVINAIIQDSSQKEGYAFSFNSGNHFLMFCKSAKRNDFYLVLHSSAKEFKDSYMGLYPPNKYPLPSKKNWYSSQIHEYMDNEERRSIRYLVNGDAKHFIELAKSLKEQNKEIHKWILEQFKKKMNLENNVIEEPKIINHYEMPTDYSVAIGTYVLGKSLWEENPDYSVPIFTRTGCPIAFFKPDMEKMHTVKLAGEERFIIPHGWGQSMPELDTGENALPESVYFKVEKNSEEKLILNIKDEQTDKSYKKIALDKDLYTDKYSLSKRLEVRDMFSGILKTKNISKISEGDFLSIMPNYLKGKITDILVPLAVYSKDTCKQKETGVHYFYTDESGRESYIDSEDEKNKNRSINISDIEFSKEVKE